jgi:hypothetical protein
MFDEHTEYILPAAEVAKIEAERKKKIRDMRESQNPTEEDMGLIEFIKTIIAWALGLVRGTKR